MTGPKVEENCRFHALAFDVALRRAPDTSPIIGIAQERDLSPKEVKNTKGLQELAAPRRTYGGLIARGRRLQSDSRGFRPGRKGKVEARRFRECGLDREDLGLSR